VQHDVANSSRRIVKEVTWEKKGEVTFQHVRGKRHGGQKGVEFHRIKVRLLSKIVWTGDEDQGTICFMGDKQGK